MDQQVDTASALAAVPLNTKNTLQSDSKISRNRSATRFEIGVADRRVPARAQLGAWYDPKSERVKT
mgnify:CR=1 FL=1